MIEVSNIIARQGSDGAHTGFHGLVRSSRNRVTCQQLDLCDSFSLKLFWATLLRVHHTLTGREPGPKIKRSKLSSR